ncbi:MAG: serine protein kinase RIO, partial [Thermoplasmata archaeon]|nr:serine protein kinase RIO [Thermoplasmata archaeon]NIS12881.1 serine protein kinase RIO [Thermoplasmata archaeon]NIS20792.1 serine protein kinase RIO [Thermoplasmata archaeon]NIT78200.1 serine protein kinase RIO [Thermoplasmata archaeon]NIU49863.1 serine protein kinase RIO [Thermoplasmata archaeon]
ARKEFLNLRRAHEAGVPVPEPLDFNKNVLAMSYVGEEDMAAPEVRNVKLED